jgi:hypothetical protein
MSPRQNDTNIADDTVLWRAVHKLQVYKDDDGRERAQKWAFESDDNEVSAWVAAETDLGRLRARFPHSRMAEFTAAQARECRNIVARDPVEGDASHVVICPLPGKSNSQIKKDAKRLASKARLLPQEP